MVSKCLPTYHSVLFYHSVLIYHSVRGFPSGSGVKNPPEGDAGRQVQTLGQEDPLEKEMTTHLSIFAWEILWTEEPGGLQSMGLQKVGYDQLTEHTLFFITILQ